jgi:twitching motility protein PilT
MEITPGTFDDFIIAATEKDISDIHFIPERPAFYRDTKSGKLLPFADSDILSSQQIEDMLLCKKEFSDYKDKISLTGDIDASYAARFTNGKSINCRVNVFETHQGTAIAVRIFPTFIPSMNKLGLPGVVQNLIYRPNGLIIFTAPTGNGKTTSIASMLETINDNTSKRIITIEDPVEYVFNSKRSIISQREIGKNCSDFSAGLRAALREDPDIIMVGEMRDRDTILTAIAAAESGHLVFSTLHASNVVQAVDRIKQYFNGSEQEQIQMQFANAFQAVIAQKLFPRKDESGRVAAFEVLLSNDATRNLIRTGEAFQLPGYMTAKDGMFTMQYSIRELLMRGVIENGKT